MFEKEAKERARKLEESQTLGVFESYEDYAREVGWNDGEVAGYEKGFKDGAEFGYNKANEELEEQIEKMKCCENCRHYSRTYGHCYSYSLYQNCKSLSNWKLNEC